MCSQMFYYSCEKCNFITQQHDDFLNHMVTFHCMVSYCCTLCSYFSGDRQTIGNHYMRSHCRTLPVPTLQNNSDSSQKVGQTVPAPASSSESVPVLDLSHGTSTSISADPNHPSVVMKLSPDKSPPIKPVATKDVPRPSSSGLVCSECFSALGSPDEWRCHMVQNHRWIPCLLCTESFQTYRQLEFHVRTKHRDDPLIPKSASSNRLLQEPIFSSEASGVVNPQLPAGLPGFSMNAIKNLLSTPPRCSADESSGNHSHHQRPHQNQYHPYAPAAPNIDSIVTPPSSVVTCRTCGKSFNDTASLYGHVVGQHIVLGGNIDNNNQQPPPQTSASASTSPPIASSGFFLPPMLPIAAMAALARINFSAPSNTEPGPVPTSYHQTAPTKTLPGSNSSTESPPDFLNGKSAFDPTAFLRMNAALSSSVKLLQMPLPPLSTSSSVSTTVSPNTNLMAGGRPCDSKGGSCGGTSESASSLSSFHRITNSNNNNNNNNNGGNSFPSSTNSRQPDIITNIQSTSTSSSNSSSLPASSSTTPGLDTSPNVQQMALQCIAEMTLRGSSRQSVKQPFVCKLCQRNLSSSFSLLCHYRSHAGIKPYSCPVCHARFTQQNSLSYHLLIHKNLKPFTCSICPRSYRNKQLYKKHMRLHNNNTANNNNNNNDVIINGGQTSATATPSDLDDGISNNNDTSTHSISVADEDDSDDELMAIELAASDAAGAPAVDTGFAIFNQQNRQNDEI